MTPSHAAPAIAYREAGFITADCSTRLLPSS
jgi:hypothetical protein